VSAGPTSGLRRGGEAVDYILAIFVPLVFPDGRLPSRRWRPLVWLVGAGVVIYVVDAALEPGGPDPLGVELPPNIYGVLVVVGIVLFIVAILGAAASVALRLWRARGQERQQLKWLVYATSVVMVGMLGAVLFPPPLGDVFWIVTVFGLAAMPVAVGVAVLRYNLYDIDLVINRTLVYGSLIVLLAGTYYGSVAVLQGVFRTLTGQQSTLAVVASTLAIAALFVPLRRRIQGFIDRVFYCGKYGREKDSRSLLCQATRRNRPRCLERRPHRSGEGDDATGPHLFVAAPRHDSEGRAGRLAAPYSLNSEKVNSANFACSGFSQVS
jgi:hypothetical protein